MEACEFGDISMISHDSGETPFLQTDAGESFIAEMRPVQTVGTGASRVFKIRDGPHLQDRDFKAKNFCFPPENQMRFDNPIVGFIHKPGRWCGVNVIMKDGTQSQLPLNIHEGQGYSKVLI